MTDCSCQLAGYCARHQVAKSEHWVHLCKTHQGYWRLWEEGRGPGQPVDYERPAEKPRDRIQRLRDMWAELHTYNPEQWNRCCASQWLDAWVERVPSFGCGCREHFRELLKLPENMPQTETREAFFAWTVHIHNQVNQKLSKPILPLTAAEKRWL